MKKIMFILFISFILISLLNPSIKKVEASQNQYALITTIYDDEDNGSFENAVIVEEDSVSIDSPGYSNDYIGGTLSGSSDVDYFCFRVFYSGTIYFRLSMYDEGMNSSYNYNFQVYKQTNTLSTSFNPYYFTLVDETTYHGTNETCSIVSEPTNYYVKVYGINTGYSSRFSYKLEYEIYSGTRRSFNISDYARQSNETGGYIVWESDFVFNNYRSRLDANDYIFYNTSFNNYPISKDYYFDNYGYPAFELYFWGKEYRNTMVEYLNQIIDELEKEHSLNESVTNITSELTIIDGIAKLIVKIFSGPKVISIPLAIIDGLLLFTKLFFNQETTYSIQQLITYYRTMKDYVEDKDGELDDYKIFAITYKMVLHNTDIYSPYYVLRGKFDNTGCRYTTNREYNHSYIYDIKQYDHNGDGRYTNIYGKYYIEEANSKLDAFLS
jgi:hypothetical protein